MSKREQFAMIPGGAADCTAFSLIARVYIALNARAGGQDDRYVWPSQQTLADRFGVSRRAVGRAIERLVRERLLVPAGHHVQRGSNQWTNRYYVPLYLHVGTPDSIVADETPHDGTFEAHDGTFGVHDGQRHARKRARPDPKTRPKDQNVRDVENAKDQRQDTGEPIAAYVAAATQGGDMDERPTEDTVVWLQRRPRPRGSDDAQAEGRAIKARRQANGQGAAKPRSRKEQLAWLKQQQEEGTQ